MNHKDAKQSGSELEIIEGALQRAARRARWHRAWDGFWQGLLAGSVLWLVVLALYKILPLPAPVLFVAGLVAAVQMPLGIFLGGWRSVSLTQIARWVDARLHLQERLGSALELAMAPPAGSWRALLLADAAQYARQLDPRQLIPWQLPALSRWVLLVLALGAGLGFVPEYRSQTYLQKKRETELLRDTGRQLAELTRRQLIQHPPALAPVRQNLETVVNLGDQLSQVKLTRSEALRDLANVADKLKQEARLLMQNPALKRLEQAARVPGGRSSTAAPALQKQIEQLQKALGKQAANSNALEQLKQDLQKAQEAAAGLANPPSAGDSATREQLGKSLAALSQKSQAMGFSLPGLEEAITALASDQTELLLRDLQNALTDLEKLQAMAQTLQQLQQQAERLGKDLAEQLKNGQVQAAQATLEKMVAQLKASQLPAEQLQRILHEVSQAVNPAGEYGKVADLLKQAVGQIRQAQRPEAAQSLADAAKELEKLMEELGDAESLIATLKALQKAQMCVGLGECQGTGPGGRPGSSRNPTRGGRGFGTWANEDGWLDYPEMSDLWENPPDNRGAMDPRSTTDRGEGRLADNLDPTKIRGRISPGSSMPSITLKGVSIKGQSTVTYEQAVLAAQAEAQSALSQEQIPRAYQGAVKEYFDDLKK